MKTLKRRRQEQKTDYGKRLKLLKSGKPRVVFRKTNKYVIGQYVTSSEAQDKIELGVSSKNLIKYGWPESAKGSLKSITASYLTGLLIGKQILSKKLEMPIVDLGMLRTSHKTKPLNRTLQNQTPQNTTQQSPSHKDGTQKHKKRFP